MFTNIGEAMVATWRVLEEMIHKHLQPIMVAHQYSKTAGDPIDIGAELVGIRTRLEQGLFRTPYDVHTEVVCLWRQCLDKASNSPLYQVRGRVSMCVCLSIWLTHACVGICST